METKPDDLADLAETSGRATEEEAPKMNAAAVSEPQDPAPMADVPDPDEDDLDDLDGQ